MWVKCKNNHKASQPGRVRRAIHSVPKGMAGRDTRMRKKEHGGCYSKGAVTLGPRDRTSSGGSPGKKAAKRYLY